MSNRGRWLVIVQSGFYRAALQLGNIPIVLPFVVTELNAELWIAALIFPAFTAGGAVGNVLAPKALDAVPRGIRLFIVVLCLAGLAVATALCATLGSGNVAGIILTANAVVIGAVSAFAFVAFADLIAAVPSGHARAHILLTEAGAGAVLTVVATLALLLLPHPDQITKNVHLLWASAAAMAISGGICLALPRRLVPDSHMAPGLRELVRMGWSTVRADRWYRHYLIVQMLFGSVVFGSSFYSIRVAAIDGYDHDDVVIFVIVVCVGLLVGIPLWSRVRTRFGLIGLFVGGAMLSVAAAALAIAFQVANVWPNVVVISATLALTSVANQSVFAAGQLWISHFAGPRLRVVLISFGQVVISAGLIMLSLPLGVVAGRTEALWPVTVVLLLNVIAAYSARRLAPHDH